MLNLKNNNICFVWLLFSATVLVQIFYLRYCGSLEFAAGTICLSLSQTFTFKGVYLISMVGCFMTFLNFTIFVHHVVFAVLLTAHTSEKDLGFLRHGTCTTL